MKRKVYRINFNYRPGGIALRFVYIAATSKATAKDRAKEYIPEGMRIGSVELVDSNPTDETLMDYCVNV